MQERVLRVGTRGSPLARRQAEMVAGALAAVDPSIACDLRIITTIGDESPQDLQAMGGEGVFVSAIESALRVDAIDVAVHSFKDVPTGQPSSLFTAYLPRGDPRDTLVTRSGWMLADLDPGVVIGTGSPRRKALLLDLRPDLQVEPIRGNVDTRLRRVAEGTVDGAILAAAGLERLERLDEVSDLFEVEQFVPAVGQGIIAIQCSADSELRKILTEIDDAATHVCADAERAAARELEAGCRVPMGAHARLVDGDLRIDAFIESDGVLHRIQSIGLPEDAEALGRAVGLQLKAAAAPRSPGA